MSTTQHDRAVRNALTALRKEREAAPPALLEALDRIAAEVIRTGDPDGVGRQLADEVDTIRGARVAAAAREATIRALVTEVVAATRPGTWPGSDIDQLHRAINRAAAPARSEVGEWDDEEKAYSDLAFSAAVDAIGEAMRTSADLATTIAGLRSALDMLIAEAAR